MNQQELDEEIIKYLIELEQLKKKVIADTSRIELEAKRLGVPVEALKQAELDMIGEELNR